MHPPPSSTNSVSADNCKKKINNADHFEFIMRLKKTFPVFDFCIYHYDLFSMVVLCSLNPPPLSHTHTTTKNTGSMFAYFLVKKSETRFHTFRHWIAFCRCSRAIWIASERKANYMKICFSFRCNSYGPWTPTKCDSILIFTSFNNKVCCDIAYFNTKMSHLSNFKRTKSKTLRTAKKTEDELKKSAVWSSANNTNKRLTF